MARSAAALAVLAACGFGPAAVAGASERTPVVIVPGVVGSSLEVRMKNATMPHAWCDTDTGGDWMSVWLSPVQLLPAEKDCLIARLTLTYDAESDTYSNLPGVELRAVGLDGGSGASWLYSYEFQAMFDRLKKSLGYTLDKDLFLAPYDWRLTGDAHAQAKNGVGGFYNELKSLVERTVQAEGRKVLFLSHSMGCPTVLDFFHHFVDEGWRKEHVEGWLALAPAWMGSASQYVTYLSGYTFHMPMPHDYIRPVQVNASSAVWLSPNPMVFGTSPIVTTPMRNYTASDLGSLIKLIGDVAGGEQALAFRSKPVNNLARIQKPPSHVPVYNWYSVGVPTYERFEFDEEISKGFSQAPVRYYSGDGDGTVNAASLRSPEVLWPVDSTAPVTSQVFPKVNHFSILSDSRFLDALQELLRNKMLPIVV